MSDVDARLGPNVVALGGGHGLAASLTALRKVTQQLTAIVTVADDGGSSGRLRDEFDILPPGDLRMALAALCSDDDAGKTWAAVLQARFQGDGPLAGHAIGNLLIAGLWQQLGDELAALDMVGDLLGVQGRVIPMSTVPLEIEADVLGLDPLAPDEINTLIGQASVAKAHAEVRSVRLMPHEPPAHPSALEAIEHADAIVLGPGSWFTSVIPHLLVPQLRDALMAAQAQRVLVFNIAPRDETAGMSAGRHIEILAEHAPKLRLDAVIADAGFAQRDPHMADYVRALGAELVVADVASSDGAPTHDPERLAAVFAEVIGQGKR